MLCLLIKSLIIIVFYPEIDHRRKTFFYKKMAEDSLFVTDTKLADASTQMMAPEEDQKEEKAEETNTEPPQSAPSPEPEPILTPKTQPPEENKEEIPKEDVEKLINDAKLGKDLSEYNSRQLNAAWNNLNQQKTELAKTRAYVEADKVTKMMKKIRVLANQKAATEKREQKIQELVQKRDECQVELDNVRKIWENKLADFDAQVKIKVQQLYDQQGKELADFDANSEKEIDALQIRDTKELLKLKSREEGLVKNEMFIRAQSVRTKIEQLEQEVIENQKNQKRDELSQKRQQLTNQQIQQLRVIEQWANEKVIDLSRQMAGEIGAAEKRVRNYDVQIAAVRTGKDKTAKGKKAEILVPSLHKPRSTRSGFR